MNDNQPLKGHVILNTRPSHQAVNDSERLKQLGAKVAGGYYHRNSSIGVQKSGCWMFIVALLDRLSPSFIDNLWQHRRVDIILITSEMALRHFYNQFSPQAHDWLG